MHIIRHRGYARVGLIGNPSDGYGGKTIALTINSFWAEVVLYPWEQLEIVGSAQDKSRFGSLAELVEDVELNGYYGGVRLVKATLKRFAEYCLRKGWSLRDDAFSVRYQTNIPRGVGLSGSSAIIVATLRCLMDYYGVAIAPRVQASLARAVENDELGIACGYQDRVAQVYGGLVYMDFGRMESVDGYECGRYEPLDPSLLPPLYLAYDLSTSKTSQSVHGPLRARVQDSQQLAATIAQIADLVPQARRALEQHDRERLHQLLNRNFDLRASLYNIRPSHRLMVDTARSVGAAAKFAGSGGSIVGTYAGDAMYERLRRLLTETDANWRVIRLAIAPPHAVDADHSAASTSP